MPAEVAVTTDPDRTDDTGGHTPADALLPEPTGWSDSLTGADGPRLWDRVMANEQARLRRYGGSVTIVLLEFLGFDELATWVGRDVAIQTFGRVSRVMAGEIRSSDHIARIAPNRFAVMLIQTDEVRTLNFIDRVLRACRPELDATGGTIRVGVGWASPSPVDNLIGAITVAEERLATDFFTTRDSTEGSPPAK